MLYVIFVMCGFAAGILAGLFGVGGGLLNVPILYQVFVMQGVAPDLAMLMAVSTSLAIIVPTSLSSIYSHYRRDNIAKDIATLWALPTVLGVLLAGQILLRVEGASLKALFAVLMLAIAVKLYFSDVLKNSARQVSLKKVYQIPIAFCNGVVSALGGVGGGALAGPVLMLSGLSAHKATGTAAVFGLLIAAPSVVSLLYFGETPPEAPAYTVVFIYLPALFIMAIAASLAAPLGARLNRKFSARALQISLSIILLLIGLRMMVGFLYA